ncbi:MAG: phosphoglycerate kinase [bacterium]|nr:phosphoglycerate kinase [bacterium]
MPSKLSVRDLDVAGKTVFVRVDFNVPLNDRQEVTDDTRIAASLQTINHLLERNAAIVLASHLGRPKGKNVFEMSLSPVADRLAELVKSPVRFARDCVGAEVKELIAGLNPGEILLLENLRFHAEETTNDADFARELAEGCDLYVNDAFGTAHRAHASTEGMTRHFSECAAGMLVTKELDFLGQMLQKPKRPSAALLGGAKISGKIPVIESLLKSIDTIMIGGGMAFTFFRALGLNVGASLVDEELLETAKRILDSAKEVGREILLPVDLVIAREISNDAETKIILPTDIPEGWMGLDIGPKTIALYSDVLERSQSVFWNGPMGVFEVSNFAKGTMEMATAMATATGRGTITVVGGGDSVAAIAALGLKEQFGHISTGGGASLEYMEGKPLPGVEALSELQRS